MTPQERDLVNGLFDRLVTLERSPREPDAENVIRQGMQRAPNSVYALVQTVLVQDEALKRADARIRDLEAQLTPAEPPRAGGFLDNMRGALFGHKDEPQQQRQSSVPQVPPVRQGDTPMGSPPAFGGGGAGPGGQGGYAPNAGGVPPAQPGRGGSFLGTMAASAAGVIGGAFLLDGIRSMMGGGGNRQTFGDVTGGGLQNANSPWSNAGGSGGGGSGSGGGNLARDAGLDDIGRNPAQQQDTAENNRNVGLFGDNTRDDPNNEDDYDDGNNDDSSGDGGDSGGGGGDD